MRARARLLSGREVERAHSIFCVSRPFLDGGPQKRLFRLARGWAARGHVTVIAALRGDLHASPEELEEIGLPVYLLTEGGKEVLKSFRTQAARSLRGLVGRLEPKVVFSMETLADYQVRLGLMRTDVPIVTLLGIDRWKWEGAPHRVWLMRRLARHRGAVIGNSSRTLEGWRRVMGAERFEKDAADPRYARQAEAILLAYANALERFTLGHNWLGDCWLMEDFLFGYDTIYESVSQESRQVIDQKLLMVEILRNYHYNHHYPEGYIRLSRMCVWAALLAKNKEWLQFLVFSPTGNREVSYRYGLTDDFVSLKGAAYGGDIVRGLTALGVTLENCGVTFFDARAKSLYDALPRQIFPDRSLPAFGHSNVGYPVGMYDIDVPYRYYRDPVYLALTAEGWRQDRGARIFWEDDELPAVAPLKLPSSHLTALGITFLRTPNDGVLALSWGAPQRNDPARLDFQYYGAGGQLLWSSGICGYANPYFGTWYQQSLSRNGLVVDEGTQAAKAGRVLFLDTKGPEQVVAAELVDAYPNTRWVRTAVLFASGEALLLDRLTSPTDRTVDWVCQLPGKVETGMELPDIKTPFGDKCGYGALEGIRGGAAPQALALTVRHTGRGVRLTPAYSAGTQLYLAQGRMGTAAVASPVVLLRRERVTDTVFATLLQPFAAEPPAQGSVKIEKADQKECRVKVETAGRSYKVSLTERHGETRVAVK